MAESESIEHKNISVIVQGAINRKETPECLKSIRKILPDSEIILSTWDGEELGNLYGLYDILVLNKDPGSVLMTEFSHKKVYNNMNRQLLSTKEGLKKATRKFAMKLRSDLILTDDKFLRYFNEFKERGQNYNLFRHKILASCLYTRFNIKCSNLNKKIYIPFHISDWWFFGLKSDLEKYFLDTQLVVEPDFTNYFELKENKAKISPYGKPKFKFSPEQYFGYSCFSRNFDDIYMQDASDTNDDLMEKFRQCLVNNFIILQFDQSGIYLNKYQFSKNEKFVGEQFIDLYNFYRYESEYKKYCDKNYKIKTDGKFFKNPDLASALLKLYKHFYKLIAQDSPLYLRIEQLIIGIPFSSLKLLFVFFKNIRNLLIEN